MITLWDVNWWFDVTTVGERGILVTVQQMWLSALNNRLGHSSVTECRYTM